MYLANHVSFSFFSTTQLCLGIESCPVESVTLLQTLHEGMLRANLSVTQINILLRSVRRVHPELPADARTLMHTPRVCPQRFIQGGCYVHLGLEAGIRRALLQGNCSWPSKMKLQLHIDGMTLFRSSRLQLWPILGKLTQPVSHVFLVGLYCGPSKPLNVAEFLRPTIHDLLAASEEGVQCSPDGLKSVVSLESVVADAPARAFVLQIKQHSGYHSCAKCTNPGKKPIIHLIHISGVHMKRRMTFPVYTHTEPRTNEDFRNRRQWEHHVGDSPFEDLDVDMVRTFPLDYMHMLCLGVMKRLLTLWRCGPTRTKVRMSFSALSEVNKRLFACAQCLPIEFPRKCRTLQDVDRWKATEFRQFLLYLGPVVLKDLLEDGMYEHFLKISIFAYILCSRKWLEHYLPFLESNIEKIVRQLAGIYGEQELGFNVHCLLHLCEDVRRFGPLDSFCAFPFESFLRKLRRMVTGTKLPASQIFRRMLEQWNMETVSDATRFDDTCCAIPAEIIRGDNVLINGATINSRHPNNAVLVDGLPSVVLGFRNSEVCIQTFLHRTDFFTQFVPSTDLRIFKCGAKTTNPKWVPQSSITCKCVRMPIGDCTVFYPIVHSWR